METQDKPSIVHVLEFCREYGIPAQVVGKWVWVKYSGKPKPGVLNIDQVVRCASGLDRSFV